MKDEIKKEMIKAIGTYNNSLVDSIAESCANVALKYIEQSRQAAVSGALPPCEHSTFAPVDVTPGSVRYCLKCGAMFAHIVATIPTGGGNAG
jgi:hypothetical protein